MRDDLIGLILGCGCRKRCCCDEPPPAPAPASTLFLQQARTTEPPRTPEGTPFIPPPPQFDSPQRPGCWAGRRA